MSALSGSSSSAPFDPNPQPQQQQRVAATTGSTSPTATATMSTTTAVVRPMRSQSASIVVIEREEGQPVAAAPSSQTRQQQQRRPAGQHPARAVSANSCTSEESEESLPDSLEEARAPLLRRPQSIPGGDISSSSPHEGGPRAEGEEANTAEESPKTRRRIPKERRKTLLAFLLLFFAGALNDVVLSFIHDLLPETAPLPDFAFSNLPYWPWALTLSEVLMLTSFSVMLVVTISHKYRWVILRRIFTIGALLYLGRCLTMFVTQVPVADKNYYCSPKLKPEERTFWNIMGRALSVLIGLGLKINGRHTLCGDYIYSGHTIVHVICYLFIREYSPRRWKLLHYTFFCFSAVGVFSLLVSRGHYSVDIIIAYWISTRLFWLYHSLADLPALRNNLQGRNQLTKEVWYPLFLYMEGAVQRPVPRKYELPFKIPPQLGRWWRRRRTDGTGSAGRSGHNDRLMAAD